MIAVAGRFLEAASVSVALMRRFFAFVGGHAEGCGRLEGKCS